MFTRSGTPDFTPFGEFMIVLISLYIDLHCVLLNLSALGLCLRINDSGLFAWISLAALSRTYFITSIVISFAVRILFTSIVISCCHSLIY